MPSTSASASEMKLSLLVSLAPYCSIGSSTAWPCGEAAAASPSSAERLKPALPSTQTVISPAPAISRTALMICTQVVPFMPPTRT